MKKHILFILKLLLYYLLGLILFSIIAYTTQINVLAILTESVINPTQDLQNFYNIINELYLYYLSYYTILFLTLLYIVRKYDKCTVKKLNEKLKYIKGVDING